MDYCWTLGFGAWESTEMHEIPLLQIPPAKTSTASTSRSCCRSSRTCCCRAASTTRTARRTTTRRAVLGRGAARRDPGSAPEWRRAVRRDAREAARQGLADGRRRGGADRAAGAADPAEAAASGLPDRPPDLQPTRAEREPAGPRRPRARGEHHASRSPTRASTSSATGRCATCSARSAEQRRPPRHARDGDRHRGQRRAEAVRVRRHDEHRRGRHDPERGDRGQREPGSGTRRDPDRALLDRCRLRGPDGRPGRVSELLRHGADARLQPQHDPLRRGSLHAGQARGARAREPDPPAVSRRRAERRPVPRLRRGDSAQPAGAGRGSAPTTPTRAKA